MADVNPTSTDFHVSLQDGDPAAWEEFYLVYFDMMVWWARDFGCTEAEAHEVAQAKTIQLFSRNRFTSFRRRGPYSFRRWLKRVVGNEVCSYFRKARRYTSTESMGASQLEEIARDAGMSDLDDQWSQDDWSCYRRSIVNRALRAAIDQRPAKESSIFIRRVIRSEQASSICAELGINRVTFDVYLGRFRNRLSAELQRLLSDERNCFGTINEVFDESALLQFLREVDVREKESFDTLLETSVCPMRQEAREIQSMLRLLDENPPANAEQSNILVIGHENRQWYTLVDGMKIGRDEGNDIVLAGDGVSSLHASLHRTSEGWKVRDEKSTNHVHINHQLVHDEAFLVPGDWLQISTWCLIYVGASTEWPE